MEPADDLSHSRSVPSTDENTKIDNTGDQFISPSLSIPNFVEQYYKNSTFHHLSTWRMKMQQMARQAVHLEERPLPVKPKGVGSENSSQSSGSSSGRSGELFSSSTSSPEKRKSAPKIAKAPAAQKLPVSPAKLLQEEERVILHIDMDCFYVSVARRDNPGLNGLPVVICPSKNIMGTSEISSCSYEARQYGIKARMYVNEARKLCPNIVALPCQFEKYEKASEALYAELFKWCGASRRDTEGVQSDVMEAVSCDEAFLDITDWGWDRADTVAVELRQAVYNATGCPCSVGIAKNPALAYMSNKHFAKPSKGASGVYILYPDEHDPARAAEFKYYQAAEERNIPDQNTTAFLNKLNSVSDLPGVGAALTKKLAEQSIAKIIPDLQIQSLTKLQKLLGNSTGIRLFQLSRGVDPRPLCANKERKSISTQISWGVRYQTDEQIKAFLEDLSRELKKRLEEISMMTKRVALRLRKHKEGDKESDKFMNPGEVQTISRSVMLPEPTSDDSVIAEAAFKLYKAMKLTPTEVRGAALACEQLTKKSSSKRRSKSNNNAPKVNTLLQFLKPSAKQDTGTTNNSDTAPPPLEVSDLPSSEPDLSLFFDDEKSSSPEEVLLFSDEESHSMSASSTAMPAPPPVEFISAKKLLETAVDPPKPKAVPPVASAKKKPSPAGKKQQQKKRKADTEATQNDADEPPKKKMKQTTLFQMMSAKK